MSFLRKVKNKEIATFASSMVLAETNWTLLRFYKFLKNKVIKGLNSIVNLKSLKIIDEFNLGSAMDLYAGHSVKFIDALITSIPQIAGGDMIAVSYDKDFDKLNVKRKEPKEV